MKKLIDIFILILFLAAVFTPGAMVHAEGEPVITCEDDANCVQDETWKIHETSSGSGNANTHHEKIQFDVPVDTTLLYYRVDYTWTIKNNKVDQTKDIYVFFGLGWNTVDQVGIHEEVQNITGPNTATYTYSSMGQVMSGADSDGANYLYTKFTNCYSTSPFCDYTFDWSIEVQTVPFVEDCSEDYLVVEMRGPFVIDPLVEAPVGAPTDEQYLGMETGETYMLQVLGGPWDDGTDERYDTAVSFDGVSWMTLAELAATALCVEQDLTHPELMTIYFTATTDDFFIRVNDTAGNFADNTEVGELTYLMGLVALDANATCESQFTYDEGEDWLASVNVDSTVSTGVIANPSDPMQAGEWYAIAVATGTWTDNGGDPRVDMEFYLSAINTLGFGAVFADLAEGTELVWCQTEDGLITFIQSDNLYINLRANDQDSNFANNAGTLGVNIYHAAFNRAEDTCEMQFALDDIIATNSVDARQDEGKLFVSMLGTAIESQNVTVEDFSLYGLVPGAWYAVQTKDGPWGYEGLFHGTEAMSYDLAIGEVEGGFTGTLFGGETTWLGSLSEWEMAECNVPTDALGHRLVYFQMPIVGDYAWKLRVNDTEMWLNNTGYMAWDIYRVIDLAIPENEICDYSYNEGDKINGSVQTAQATATNGAYIQGLEPDTYYAIEMLDFYKWYEENGDGMPRTDFELSVNNGQLWNDVPGGTGALCAVESGDDLVFFIHTPEDAPQYRLRVNSSTFANNAGFIAWNVYLAEPGDSVNQWDGCVTEGYDITQLAPREWIPVTDASGRVLNTSAAGSPALGGLVPGEMYIVSITGGPWYDGENSLGLYSAQVSSDGGTTWQLMDGTNTDISCWEVSQNLRYLKIEFTVEQGQSWRIRVNDTDTATFGDNTGNLAYVLDGLVIQDDPTVDGTTTIPPAGCDVTPISPGALDVSELLDLGNYLAGWFAYVSGSITRFLSWCPEHTAFITSLGDRITEREPFATLDEFDVALVDIRNEINGYSWGSTHDYSILNKSPSASAAMIAEYVFADLPDDSPWINGDLLDVSELTGGTTFTSSCGLAVTDYVGEKLGQGVCFATDWARETGAMFWIQLSLDVTIFFACIASMLGNLRKIIYLFTGVNLSTQRGDAKVFVNTVREYEK